MTASGVLLRRQRIGIVDYSFNTRTGGWQEPRPLGACVCESLIPPWKNSIEKVSERWRKVVKAHPNGHFFNLTCTPGKTSVEIITRMKKFMYMHTAEYHYVTFRPLHRHHYLNWVEAFATAERLLLLLCFCSIVDSQHLCRRNERYAECGRCEATCKNPNTIRPNACPNEKTDSLITNIGLFGAKVHGACATGTGVVRSACRPTSSLSALKVYVQGCRRGCLPSRCECVAALNYVRDRHGACIKITDCDVPSILIAFESREAFRKIFGKLYNEGEPEDGERSDSTKNDEHNTAKPPQSDVEGVHSYPPENLFPHADTHSYPPELPTEDMGIHSYPPESRLHDVPVYRYSRGYRPRRTSSYGYPSYDLSEDEGVHSYPPEFPEEVGTHDYVPLPFISDYGNIASHQSGTFYYQLGKKGDKKQEHYDPYSPRRFEKAKVRSKLKESSILRQVPPEVRMTLRDIGGTASLRELANAKVLFEFQPDDIDQKLREGEDKSIQAWTSSPSTTVAHTISPRTSTIQPRSNHLGDIAVTPPEAAIAATPESAYQEWSTGAPLSSYQRTTLSEGLEENPSGSIATTTAPSHSQTSTQRGSYKPSTADADDPKPSVVTNHEVYDCPCATVPSLQRSNNVTQMTVEASTTALNAESVTESPLRAMQSSITHENETSLEGTAFFTPANHQSDGWTNTHPSQKDTNNVTQATASSEKSTNNITQATVEASGTTPNPTFVTESPLETIQSSTTQNGTCLEETTISTPTNHRSNGWTNTPPGQKGTVDASQTTASSQEGTNSAAQAPEKDSSSTLNTTAISGPLEPTRSASTHETGTSREATLHSAPEKHRSDGWAKMAPGPEGANNETQKTVVAPAAMQNTTNVTEPDAETRHPSYSPEYSTSQVPGLPHKHRNDGWTRPIFTRPNANVQQSVAIVLPPSPSASNDEQFRLQYRKYAVSSHSSPQQSNRLSYTFNTPFGRIFFEKSSSDRKPFKH